MNNCVINAIFIFSICWVNPVSSSLICLGFFPHFCSHIFEIVYQSIMYKYCEVSSMFQEQQQSNNLRFHILHFLKINSDNALLTCDTMVRLY